MRKLCLYLIWFFMGATSACRPKVIEPPKTFIDPILRNYMEDFIEDAQRYGIAISDSAKAYLRVVSFVDSVERKKREYGQEVTGDNLAGACTDVVADQRVKIGPFSQGPVARWQEIWISTSITGAAPTPPLVLKELMYHELGHCFLGLDHASGTPHQIMSPSLSGDVEFLADQWTSLVGKLFHSKTAFFASSN